MLHTTNIIMEKIFPGKFHIGRIKPGIVIKVSQYMTA